MNSDQKYFDVFILGAGFTGNLLAISLLKINPELRVLIIDRESKSSKKVGESTSDLTALYLQLHLPLEVRGKHIRKSGLRFIFSDGSEFLSPLMNEKVEGYQINREVFDSDLTIMAKKLGATIWKPAKIISFSEIAEFQTKIKINYLEEELDLTTKWFVDCSGRGCYLQKKFAWKNKTVKFETASSWFYIPNTNESLGVKCPPNWNEIAVGSEENATTHFFGKGYWVWYFPLSDGTISLGLSYEKVLFPESSARVILNQIIQSNDHLKKILRDFDQSKIHHLDNLAHLPTQIFKKGFLTIGDSAAFIDPLFSTGLELAFQQILSFTPLLLTHLGNDSFNLKLWEKTEQQFITAFQTRLLGHEFRYRVMHHGDISLNWMQLDFWGYLTFYLMPSFYNPSKYLSRPLRFQPIELKCYKILIKRYLKLSEKKDFYGMKESVLKQKFIYSYFSIPNSRLQAIWKSIHLFFRWGTYYLMLECLVFIGTMRAKRLKNQTQV